MALWNDETKRTIRGLFTNRFAPKRYRGVTGVTMAMGELVGGWGVSGGINNDNIGNGRWFMVRGLRISYVLRWPCM